MRSSIDDFIERVIQKREPEWREQMMPLHLRSVWRWQIKRLIQLGFPEKLGMSLTRYIMSIPPPFYDPFKRPPVLVDNRVGPEELRLAKIKVLGWIRGWLRYNRVDYYLGNYVGRAPYWIYIEDGSACLNLSFPEGLTILKGRKQRPLTLSESVALIIYYPQILRRHSIYVGGRFDSDGELDLLWPKEVGILEWKDDKHTVVFSCECFDDRTGNFVRRPWGISKVIGLPSCDGEFKTSLEDFAQRCLDMSPEED